MTDTAARPATARSDALFATAQRLLPGGVNSPVRAFRSVGGTPRFMARGAGAWLEDADGNRYVDLVGSWGPLILGHAHPAVLEALARTARDGTTFGAPTELEVRLAERVVATFPSVEMVRFVSSGTEAAMSALRLARAATKRDAIVKFDGCYHGHADALLAAAGSGVATLGLPDSPGVTAATVRDTLIAPFNDLDAVAALFRARGDQIAAVMLEPVVGNMGVVPPVPGFLEGLRELTARHGALLVFDEVMTGWRVHPRGAQALYGIAPDLTVLGKVMGGGLPAAGYGGRRDLMQLIAPAGPVYQAGTLSGNPLAMAAGLATLDELARPGVWERAERWAADAERVLATVLPAAGVPVTVQRVGTMLTAFFTDRPVRNYDHAKATDKAAYNRFFHAMLDHGVYLPPSAFEAAFTSAMHGAPELAHFRAACEAAAHAR
ncbi:MAG: glutamate-1-semialdehyde 2,1-aminomutase [Gemmatimonadales bacterium]|jgi:glutamate-1-semialdehyde 2,1-aminomutase|nr:glutamate-1-semialdehyde 2,1-aminomutase [Gemmatimonadales bacterium]